MLDDMPLETNPPNRPQPSVGHRTLPLSDVRVVSIEQYAAGPYATLHLAELGADVIKIEPPGGGDVGRAVPPYRSAGDSLFFQSLNRNKRSVAIDLQTLEGRRVLRELIACSDAVYSNLRGDVPRKLGIVYDQLRDVNPMIVCCSLSGYGMTGPRASEAGYDYMIQGIAGWMTLTGEPDAIPAKTGLSVVDFASGFVSAFALLAGIHAARREGRGLDCDTSLFDTAISMLNYQGTWQLSRGYQPRRTARSSHPTLVPFGMFPTSDGWVVTGGSKEKFWRRLVAELGLGELLDDKRFADFDARLVHRDELIPLLDAVFCTDSTLNWVTRLTACGVPVAPTNDVEQALSEPQTLARNLVFEQVHPEFGYVGQLRSPVRVGTLRESQALAPRLGEHTHEVLADLLGYPPDRITKLIEEGVVTASD